MPTLQLSTKDYGKYALFDVKDGDTDVHPIYLSFNLSEVINKARELEEEGKLKNPAIEQVKDPSICWNY
jgi:hypothetical protein